MQFLERGRYVAVEVDGEMKTYGSTDNAAFIEPMGMPRGRQTARWRATAV